jgi:hypothetical protein
MPVSGTYAYTTDTRTLVKDALIEAQVIADSDPIRGDMMAWGVRRLNYLIKHLQTKGLQLWRMLPCHLVLVEGQDQYRLSNSGVYAGVGDDFVVTEMASAALSGGTTLTVDSNSGIAASDIIGVEQDDGTMHWTTVGSVAGTTSIIISVALTDDVAVDNKVYAFTNYIPKPLRIYDAVYHDRTTDHKVPLIIEDRNTFRQLPVSGANGRVNSIYFNPEREDAVLQVWPAPNTSVDTIDFTAQLPFSNMVEPTDSLQFPDWWFEPLHLSLAHALARSYQAPAEVISMLKVDAREAVKSAEGFDEEQTTVYMTPQTRFEY